MQVSLLLSVCSLKHTTCLLPSWDNPEPLPWHLQRHVRCTPWKPGCAYCSLGRTVPPWLPDPSSSTATPPAAAPAPTSHLLDRLLRGTRCPAPRCGWTCKPDNSWLKVDWRHHTGRWWWWSKSTEGAEAPLFALDLIIHVSHGDSASRLCHWKSLKRSSPRPSLSHLSGYYVRIIQTDKLFPLSLCVFQAVIYWKKINKACNQEPHLFISLNELQLQRNLHCGHRGFVPLLYAMEPVSLSRCLSTPVCSQGSLFPQWAAARLRR